MGRWSEYRIESELARGGMGVVYAARHAVSGDSVVIKVLLAPAANTAQLQRFALEGEALRKIDHPNVVCVRGVGVEQGRPYLVMDRVPGQTLRQRLSQSGPFDPREAASIAQRLASALVAIHGAGLLHRDIKPANVIVTEQGQPRLTDFGLAKDLSSQESGLTHSGAFLGTPGFAPPEQVRMDTGAMAATVDVYGLGATLYALLTGVAPSQGETLAEILVATHELPPTPPSELRDGVPADLDTICLTCLEKSHAARYPTAQSLHDDLVRFLSGEPIEARRRRRRSRSSILMLGSVVLGLSLFAAVQLRGANELPSHTPAPAASRGEKPDRLWTPARLAAVEGPLPRCDHGDLVGYHAAQYNYEREDYLGALDLLNVMLVKHPDDATALRLSGRSKHRLNDLLGAREDLRRAQELTPDDGEAYHLLGHVLMELEYDDEAIECLSAGLAVDPNGPAAREMLNERGQLREKLGLRDEELSDLSQLLASGSRDPEAFFQLGVHATARGDFDLARTAFDRGLEIDPDHVNLHFGRGQILVSSHFKSFKQALMDFDFVLENGSRPNGELHRLRGLAREQMGDLLGALEDYESAVKLSPNDARVHQFRAKVYIRQGRVDEALADLERAIELEGPKLEWLWLQAFVLLEHRRPRGALRPLKRALELAPDETRFVQAYAVARERTSDWEGALEGYERMVELDGENATTLTNRGWAKRNLERREQALTDFEAAIRLDPEWTDAWDKKTQTLYELERYPEALATAEWVVELQPEGTFGHQYRALSLLELGEADEALAVTREFVGRAADSAAALRVAGLIFQRCGADDPALLEEAIPTLRRSLELEGDHVRAQWVLGLCLRDTGRSAEAVEYLEAALKLWPSGAEGRSDLLQDLDKARTLARSER